MTVACLVVLVAATVTAFLPALEAGFINWDDDKLIQGNGAFRGFSEDHLKWMFTARLGGHWQPLTWISYAVDDGLVRSGVLPLETFAMHLTNLMLHLISAVLFYFVSRRLIALALRSSEWAGASETCDGPRAGDARENASSFVAHAVLSIGALVAALGFAVHPLRVESVAWITERRDVLCMALLQATTLCYLAWVHRPCAAWRLMTIGWFLLALLAKASAVAWPVVLLILDGYPLRRLRTATNVTGAGLGRLVLEKLPLWLGSAMAAAMAWRAQVETNAAYTLHEYPLHLRCAQAAEGLVFYISRTVLPIGLGPLIQIPPASVLFGPQLLGNVAAVAIAAALIWRWRQRRPFLAASAGVYVVNLLPVLGFFQSGPQLVADRYSYFACLPWAIIAGGLATGLLNLARSKRSALPAVAAVPVVLAGLLILTRTQCDYWKDSITLWTRGVRISPNSAVAHQSLACALGEQAVRLNDPSGKRAAADHFRLATQLEPTNAVSWHYLGRLLARTDTSTNLLKEAEAALKRAITLDPSRAEAYLDLSDLYDQFASATTNEEARQWRRAADEVLRDGAEACPENPEIARRLARPSATP